MDGISRLIDASASPAVVAGVLQRMAEEDPDLVSRLEACPRLAGALVAVVGASRSMARLCESRPEALDILADLDTPPAPGGVVSPERLVEHKQLELLRVAARDLLGLDSLEVVGASLARLGDDVLGAALGLAGGSGLAVIGMGKLGACELNYSSDVDLMFVAAEPDALEGATSLARGVLELAGRCYKLDLALRPEGRSGPLVRSLASYRAYWKRWARPWERQALLKARPVAGDAALGAAFTEAAAEAVWTRPWGAAEIREARDMKARTEAALARRGLAQREVKSGPGGIRDVEFSVQLLQLVHGRADPRLREPATLPAIGELARGGYVSGADAAVMEASYRYLRTVEHRLQLVEERQVHAVPTDPVERSVLARVLGYRDRPAQTALVRFDDELRRHRRGAREVHERLFFRPLLEAFAILPAVPATAARRAATDAAARRTAATAQAAGRPVTSEPVPAGPAMTPGAVSERLAAFGFSDAQRTRAALAELAQGLTRSSRLMAQMLALVLSWLSEEPDPELGLLRLRTLADGAHRRALLVATFRDSPLAARRLCHLLGTSGSLHELLRHEPELIPTLGDDAALALATRAELVERGRAALRSGRSGSPTHALLRFKQSQLLRIAARDLLGMDGVEATGAALSVLAEAVLEVALEAVAGPLPMAIVAMGRLGGGELSYASDLDLMVVLGAQGGAGLEAGEEAVQDLLRLLHGPTPAERVFSVDPNLRPEGRQGRLARSLEGYRIYYERWARTWERQALVRARPVAGSAVLGQSFAALVDDFVWAAPFTDQDVRDVRRMKARVERERVPPGEDARFHLKLGPGALADVEWTAQLLQLEHKVPSTGTLDALAALHAAGVLDAAETSALVDAYRRCEQVRNRWSLMGGTPADSLPVAGDRLGALAHSLDTTPTELRQGYRRVTRRARRVVRARFYGMDAGAGPPP